MVGVFVFIFLAFALPLGSAKEFAPAGASFLVLLRGGRLSDPVSAQTRRAGRESPPSGAEAGKRLAQGGTAGARQGGCRAEGENRRRFEPRANPDSDPAEPKPKERRGRERERRARGPLALAQPLPADDRTKHTRATGGSGGNASPPRERAPRQSKTAVLRLALKRRGTIGGTPNSAFAAHTEAVVCFPSGKGCWIASKQRPFAIAPPLVIVLIKYYLIAGCEEQKALPSICQGRVSACITLDKYV